MIGNKIKKFWAFLLTLWLSFWPVVALACNTNAPDFELSSAERFTAADSDAWAFATDMTFEGWIKYETLPADTGSSVMQWLWVGDSPNISWRLFDVTNGFKLCTSAAGNNINCTATIDKGSFTTGVWYKWSVVYHQAAGTADYCWNGTSLATGQTGLNTSIYNGTDVLAIGADNDGAADYVDGLMDEVRISNTARYTAGSCTTETDNFTNDANTVALWHFDGAGDFLTDSSSNSHTLTNVNTVTQSSDVPYTGACGGAVPRRRPSIIFFN